MFPRNVNADLGIRMYRKDVIMAIRQSGTRPTEKLFMLLVESGGFYCIYWVREKAGVLFSCSSVHVTDHIGYKLLHCVCIASEL